MSNNDKLEQLIDDYEFHDDTIDALADDIRMAVMKLATINGSEAYRFNQIGLIYTALGELIDARAEMKYTFDQVVKLFPDESSNTNNATEES